MFTKRWFINDGFWNTNMNIDDGFFFKIIIFTEIYMIKIYRNPHYTIFIYIYIAIIFRCGKIKLFSFLFFSERWEFGKKIPYQNNKTQVGKHWIQFPRQCSVLQSVTLINSIDVHPQPDPLSHSPNKQLSPLFLANCKSKAVEKILYWWPEKKMKDPCKPQQTFSTTDCAIELLMNKVRVKAVFFFYFYKAHVAHVSITCHSLRPFIRICLPPASPFHGKLQELVAWFYGGLKKKDFI